ncbi:MAG TPA: glycerol-3-phosphate 1-O-acyltransferase PlsY [Terriglobales bacterium]|jgi:glycerol-3-phosphate acyltransferase PlsY|nr:glycerol-3-phosphate 1-O-acyltransferase PlsY [Terriglobales bacterium]
MAAFLIVAALSYSLGSIPFGYILLRIFRGEDVRQTGSGNIGATNVARSSPALGVLTLVLDALKGLAAVLLARAILPQPSWLADFAALFAVLGHMFSIWLKFRGGKGVATGLGSFVVIAPKAVLAMVCVFLVLVLAFRYVSLASIAAVGLFPVLACFLDGYRSPPRLAVMGTAAILIIARHHENIRRLLTGTESRLQLRHSQP